MFIRPFQPEDIPLIARVHVDTWRSTYAGLISDTFLQSMSYEKSEQRLSEIFTKQGVHCLVACTEEGSIFGFTSFGPERSGSIEFQGEVYALYVLKECQGCGAGRQLFEAAVKELHAAGMDSLLVWVLDGNPATHFYEKMGGLPFGRQKIEIGGEMLDEVSYGWGDKGALPGK